MNAVDIKFISDLLKQMSGIVVGLDKHYLIEARLGPVARKHNLADIETLISKLRASSSATLMWDVIDAMTTNESFFFRDNKPFDTFRNEVLPDLIQRRSHTKTLRIWCAAASTGQEPYSLAMILAEESAKLAGWQCSILGTDISTAALDRAKSGTYSQFEAQRGLSIQRLIKHFDQDGTQWRVKSDLRARVQYKSFNLMESPRALGMFDVVFCRNVLIYFDQATKSRVFDNLGSVMAKDGYLFLGGAETVLGLSDAFQPQPGHHGVYRQSPAAAAPAIAAPALKTAGSATLRLAG
jgi:chemotaxis protein methyltransferase CheR